MTQRSADLHCTAPVIADAFATLLEGRGWSVRRCSPGQVPDAECSVVVVLIRSSTGVSEVRTLATASSTPVVALTDQVEPDLCADLVAAGATGVVPWDAPSETVVAAVALAVDGIATVPAPALQWITRHGSTTVLLTDAERSWLEHLDAGLTIAKLAPVAGYSERSLYRQLAGLYQRLGVTDRSAAVKEARRRGLL